MHILSRVADSIYWLNRYVERAENYARLIETYQQLALENPELTDPLWLALVESTADTAGFSETYGEVKPESVIEYLTFNRKNPNSIISCLFYARENARSIREKISKDMWETINELYNDVLSFSAAKEAGAAADFRTSAFYRNIRRSCHAFYGISDGTLNHDETYFFAIMGRAIERADKTTRILDLQSYVLTEKPEVSHDKEMILGFALLKATSAHEMFNQIHARISAENILEFLLLSRIFPRAIIACLTQIELALHSLIGEQKGFHINPAQKKVRRLLLEMRHADTGSLAGENLNSYLDNLQVRLNEIGEEISKTYFNAA